MVSFHKRDISQDFPEELIVFNWALNGLELVINDVSKFI